MERLVRGLPIPDNTVRPGRFRLMTGISVMWIGLSMLFDGLNTLVLPDQLLRHTGDERKATLLGLFTFAGLTAGMLVQPLAGSISDRLQPRRGRAGVIGGGVGLILMSLVLLDAAWSLPALFGAYVMVQIAAAVAQAAQQGFIPDLVPASQRGTAAGVKGLMDLGGAMLGFLLLGALLGSGGTRPALIAIGAVLVATLVLTLALVREPKVGTAAIPPQPSLLQAYQIDYGHQRAFVWLVVSRFLFMLATYAVGRFLLYFIADRLHLDPDQAAQQAGALLGALALVTALAAVPGGWAADRLGRLPVMVAGALLSAFAVLLLIPADGTPAILIAGALMAVGSAGFAAANWAYTADLAPDREAARFMGLANVGTVGAAAAAGLLGPLMDMADGVAEGAGYPLLFITCSLAFVASAVALNGVKGAQRSAPMLPVEQSIP
jgi:MFS family permease